MSKEEEYEEWLGRLDVPIEAQTDIDTFRKHLADELGITHETQVQVLWDSLDRAEELAEHGIRSVRMDYPWGVEVRYGIQGMPGLWGWERVQEIRSEEEW